MKLLLQDGDFIQGFIHVLLSLILQVLDGHFRRLIVDTLVDLAGRGTLRARQRK